MNIICQEDTRSNYTETPVLNDLYGACFTMAPTRISGKRLQNVTAVVVTTLRQSLTLTELEQLYCVIYII